ncbi:MAG TPA: class I SAM-dependent methyltransferase [Solirubrobacteraceae bacterium]|jgi:SAM-dependent methyltransferase
MSDVDPTALFEPLYVAAAEGRERLRWDRGGPHPLIDEWARGLTGSGGRALVVGSGLGPDAELLAERGFEVVGFDVSPTAIATAHARFPQSRVDYRVANLLDPPAEWSHAFDLVVESLTVQSMPVAFHAQAIANVARMVAPGGTLVVVAKARDGDRPVDGPPWPLTRTELEEFAADGLDAVRIEDVRRPGVPAQWRAEFRRDPADPRQRREGQDLARRMRGRATVATSTDEIAALTRGDD